MNDSSLIIQLNSILISRNPFCDPIDDSEIAEGNDANETVEGDNDENATEEQ
jgi:hypothetical protein